MKKIIIYIMLLAVVLTGCGEGTKDNGQSNAVSGGAVGEAEKKLDDESLENLYNSYAKTLANSSSRSHGGNYMAIVDAGMPVLLVTDKIMTFGDKDVTKGSALAASVYAYNYKKKGIEFIGEMRSSGSNFPLLASEGYIVCGAHHHVKRMTVKKDEGIIEEIDNLYYNVGNKSLKHTVSTISEGKIKTVSKDKIYVNAQKQSEKYDYYLMAIKKEDSEIEFHKMLENINQ